MHPCRKKSPQSHFCIHAYLYIFYQVRDLFAKTRPIPLSPYKIHVAVSCNNDEIQVAVSCNNDEIQVAVPRILCYDYNGLEVQYGVKEKNLSETA